MNNKQIISESKFGSKIGLLVGIFSAIFALLMLNVWYILPPVGAPNFWAEIIIWIGVGFSPTVVLYRPLLVYLCYPRGQGFFITMVATISIVNYTYNILAYMPYGSLRSLLVVMFVIAGIFLGLTLEIIVKPKIVKEKTSQ